MFTAKDEQRCLLQNIERLVKDFYHTYNKFLEEWSNLCNKINLDTFDADDYINNPILQHLHSECTKYFCSIENNLRDLLLDFDKNSQTSTFSTMEKSTTKADQIALLKNLEGLFRNFLYQYDQFLEEWSDIYDDLMFDTSCLCEEKPLLEKMESYYDSYFRHKMKQELRHCSKVFKNSPLLKETV